MKTKYLIVIILLMIDFLAYGKSGCCSHHKGVSSCGANGFYICNDGTTSPTCSCSDYGVLQSKTPDIEQVIQKSYYTWIDSQGISHFSDLPQECKTQFHLLPPTTSEELEVFFTSYFLTC